MKRYFIVCEYSKITEYRTQALVNWNSLLEQGEWDCTTRVLSNDLNDYLKKLESETGIKNTPFSFASLEEAKKVVEIVRAYNNPAIIKKEKITNIKFQIVPFVPRILPGKIIYEQVFCCD